MENIKNFTKLGEKIVVNTKDIVVALANESEYISYMEYIFLEEIYKGNNCIFVANNNDKNIILDNLHELNKKIIESPNHNVSNYIKNINDYCMFLEDLSVEKLKTTISNLSNSNKIFFIKIESSTEEIERELEEIASDNNIILILLANQVLETKINYIDSFIFFVKEDAGLTIVTCCEYLGELEYTIPKEIYKGIFA